MRRKLKKIRRRFDTRENRTTVDNLTRVSKNSTRVSLWGKIQYEIDWGGDGCLGVSGCEGREGRGSEWLQVACSLVRSRQNTNNVTTFALRLKQTQIDSAQVETSTSKSATEICKLVYRTTQQICDTQQFTLYSKPQDTTLRGFTLWTRLPPGRRWIERT